MTKTDNLCYDFVQLYVEFTAKGIPMGTLNEEMYQESLYTHIIYTDAPIVQWINRDTLSEKMTNKTKSKKTNNNHNKNNNIPMNTINTKKHKNRRYRLL